MANNALGLHALTNLSSQMKTTNKAFASAVRKNLRAGVKAAGQPVMDEIKRRGSWSTSIPAAVAMTIRYNATGASIRIQVNKNKARQARALELGNRGNKGGGALRHPVFHKVGEPGGWATMPLRPFFFPAIEAQGKNIDQTMEKVVIQTARDAGFK